jgi:hypothetical protein
MRVWLFRLMKANIAAEVPLGLRRGGPDPALTLGEGAVFSAHGPTCDEIGAG